MNVHKNDVLTPRSRKLGAVGISRQTVRKWEVRIVEEGPAGLEDRSLTTDGAGWEFLHDCIANASRVAFPEVLPD